MVRNTVIFNLGVPLVAGFVVATLLLGCSGGKPESRMRDVEEKKIDLSYELEGKDKAGQECTTGSMTFQTKRELCIALQDEELNNNCAVDQRKAKFINVCSDGKADGFFVAKACNVEILNRVSGESLYKSDICAGRKRNRDLKKRDYVEYAKNGVQFVLTLKMSAGGNPMHNYTLIRYFKAPGINLNDSMILNSLEDYNAKTNSDIQFKVDCASVWSCEK